MKEQILKYFETDEGKTLLEELKKPLIDNKNDILGQLTETKKQLSDYQSKEATHEANLAKERQARLEEKMLEEGKAKELIEQHKNEYNKLKLSHSQESLNREIAEKASQSAHPHLMKLALKEYTEANLDGYKVKVDGLKNLDEVIVHLAKDPVNDVLFKAREVSGAGTKQSTQVANTEQSTNMTASMNPGWK